MIRASSMGRIMLCGASDRLQKGYPNESNDAAQEGSLAHKYASDILNGLPGNTAGNPEMHKHVTDYVNLCRSLVSQYALWGCEEYSDDGHISGTVDFFTWTPYELIVCDFKYGHGWVEVEENWQLITYSILMWLKHGNHGQVLPPKVRLIVFQPRANHPDGPIREWSFPGERLRGYYNQIQNRISEIESGIETAVPGKHCRYCRAIVNCSANWEYTSTILGMSYRAERHDMTPEQLSKELDIIKEGSDLLKHRLIALEARAEQVLKGGEIVPNYVLQQKMSALSWDVPNPIQIAAEDGIDIAKPLEPITPTQAVSQGLIDKDMIHYMASRKPGAFVLKRQDTKFINKEI